MTFEVRKPNSDKENALLITLFIQAKLIAHKQKCMAIAGVINKEIKSTVLHYIEKQVNYESLNQL